MKRQSQEKTFAITKSITDKTINPNPGPNPNHNHNPNPNPNPNPKTNPQHEIHKTKKRQSTISETRKEVT